MATIDVQATLNKWANRTSGATAEYEKGVRGVTESPTARAAAALDLAKTNYNKAIDDGRTARALQAVSREDWVNVTATKGKARLADGVASAKPKMGAFLARFLPVAAAAKEQVKNMPKGSRQASLDRVAAVMDRFKEFAGKTY